MSQAVYIRHVNGINAIITVRANPGATVTLTHSAGRSFSGVADSVTGVAVVVVKAKGTYTLSSTAAGEASRESSTSIEVTNNTAQTINYVKVASPPSVDLVADGYKITASWAKPQANFTGLYGRYGTTQPTTPSSGSEYCKTTGATASALMPSLGTTYYFAFYSYVVIGSAEYYSTSYTQGVCSTGPSTYRDVSVTSTSQNSVDVSGFRNMYALLIGPGGSGGTGNGRITYDDETIGGNGYGGGGGGGGMVNYISSPIDISNIDTVYAYVGAPGSQNSYLLVGSTSYSSSGGGNGGNATDLQVGGGGTAGSGGGNGGAGGKGGLDTSTVDASGGASGFIFTHPVTGTTMSFAGGGGGGAGGGYGGGQGFAGGGGTGGGASGSSYAQAPPPATANTGGGGGGGYGYCNGTYVTQGAGSSGATGYILLVLT